MFSQMFWSNKCVFYYSRVIRCNGRSILAGNLKLCDKTYIKYITNGIWKSVRKRIFRCLLPGIQMLHWRKQDPGSLFPRSFLNYMTQPSTTQVLVLSARSEQYGQFLTPNDWTIREKIHFKCVQLTRTSPLRTRFPYMMTSPDTLLTFP